MLINPLYLNTNTLDIYIAAIEDGLRDSESSTTQNGSSLEGSLKLAGNGGSGTKDSSRESTTNTRDHAAARLQRLISAMQERGEELGVIDIMQPEVEFPDARAGMTILWECDFYTPEIVSTLAGAEQAMATIRSFGTAAAALGMDQDGIPAGEQVDAMATAVGGLDVTRLVAGDDDDTEWKIVGRIQDEHVVEGADLEDRARVIAKVTRMIPANRWYPLINVKGLNLSREAKREQERKGPTGAKDEKNFMKGPLLVVDFLAIYR